MGGKGGAAPVEEEAGMRGPEGGGPNGSEGIDTVAEDWRAGRGAEGGGRDTELIGAMTADEARGDV